MAIVRRLRFILKHPPGGHAAAEELWNSPPPRPTCTQPLRETLKLGKEEVAAENSLNFTLLERTLRSFKT